MDFLNFVLDGLIRWLLNKQTNKIPQKPKSNRNQHKEKTNKRINLETNLGGKIPKQHFSFSPPVFWRVWQVVTGMYHFKQGTKNTRAYYKMHIFLIKVFQTTSSTWHSAFFENQSSPLIQWKPNHIICLSSRNRFLPGRKLSFLYSSFRHNASASQNCCSVWETNFLSQ